MWPVASSWLTFHQSRSPRASTCCDHSTVRELRFLVLLYGCTASRSAQNQPLLLPSPPSFSTRPTPLSSGCQVLCHSGSLMGLGLLRDSHRALSLQCVILHVFVPTFREPFWAPSDRKGHGP